MSRPIVAKIDLSALSSNLNIIRHCSPNTSIWSVVKANGYGHSLNAIYHGLYHTDGFALLDLNEAVILREKGWSGPILLLEGFFHPKDLKIIDYYKFTITVHSYWQINILMRINFHISIHVYLKLNSGMYRLGFDSQEFIHAWSILRSCKKIKTLTLMTHFSCANNLENINKQMNVVEKINNHLNIQNCLANSAAVLWHPKTHKQWIRPGIILYGASPSGKWKDIHHYGFKPVMTLQSELIAIHRVPAKTSIGYNNCYQSSNLEQAIGVVACGYADGYPRQAPTGTPVWIEGMKTRILGSISMDMLIIDLQFCPTARIGSKVELWGKHISIDKVAEHAHTLSYELMSSITARVNREISFSE